MGQTSSELKTALQNATKAPSGKPYFFAMVIKGGVEGALFADRRKVPTKWVDAAKKEFNTSTVVRGLCFGDEGKLVFETAKPGTSSMEAMAKRLAQVQCGLTIKPEFRQGRDENQIAEEEETGGEGEESATHQEKASPEALAKKAYDGLLERLQQQLREARDAKSPALPKIDSLLEFAAGKAASGDHRSAVQALQTVQTVLETPPVATTETAKPGSSAKPADDESATFNLRFAAVAAKLKQATDEKSPAASGAKAQLVQAVSLAKSKDFDAALDLLAEAEKALDAKPGTTSTSTLATSTTRRDRAPIEQDKAREFLAKVDPTEDQEKVTEATANLLDDMKLKLTQTKRMVMVDNVDQLAEAMSRENGMSIPAAAEMIANNKGRGFTGKSGTVYVLGNTPEAAHDEVHETVHLMSAPGGATQIMGKYGEQLNEACTEYFTKQMCAKLNVPDAVAYPEHVDFMKKLAPVVGYNLIYTAYMKNGGFDPVISKLTDIWVGKMEDLPTPQKPPNVKGVVNRDKALEAMDKKFLNNFPPSGPAMKFWNTVFFGG